MSIKTNKINKCMASVKCLLGTAAISSALCGFILLWNEESTSCGLTICKVLETMFFLSALVLTRDVSKLNKE